MIASMTKYSFILLNGEQDALLEKLQEVGLMDITRSVKPVDKQSSGLLADVERRRELVQAIARVQFPEDLQPATIRGELLTTAEHAVKTLETWRLSGKRLKKTLPHVSPGVISPVKNSGSWPTPAVR